MNYPDRRIVGSMSRRILIRDGIASAGALCLHGLAGPALRAFGQLKSPRLAYGSICAMGFIGSTVNPDVWYYYGADCPPPDPIQYYNMPSPVELYPPYVCPPGCNPENCRPVSYFPSKQLPPVLPSNSRTAANAFPGKNNFLSRDGLKRLNNPDFVFAKIGPNVVRPPKGENYRLAINPGGVAKSIAVRVFKFLVVASVQGRPPVPGWIGIGQEIAGDPAGLPAFDWNAPMAPKYHMSWRRADDQYFHILTMS